MKQRRLIVIGAVQCSYWLTGLVSADGHGSTVKVETISAYFYSSQRSGSLSVRIITCDNIRRPPIYLEVVADRHVGLRCRMKPVVPATSTAVVVDSIRAYNHRNRRLHSNVVACSVLATELQKSGFRALSWQFRCCTVCSSLANRSRCSGNLVGMSPFVTAAFRTLNLAIMFGNLLCACRHVLQGVQAHARERQRKGAS